MEADKPFDATALADTVLRSSDNVHFYVLGAFLRYASPTFRDLFSLSQGSATDKNEIKDGYPIIPLPEDSKAIHCLLSIIHPYINKPKLDDGRLLIEVWEMAEKYGMDTVVGKLQKRLLKDQWMKNQPQRVFAIAVIFGWKDGAEKAKQKLVSKKKVPYCDEFEEISGADYYGLLEHRFCHENPERTQHQVAALDRDDDTSVSNFLVISCVILNSFRQTNIRDASEPFDSQAKADIILRSSDAVDFYVSQPLLQLISPVFDQLFSNTEGSDSKNGLRVVHVTDRSRAFRHFLLALHHCMDKPPVENPGLIAEICEVARKYAMPTIEARMKEQLTASSSLVENPLGVYAIATALGWADVAKVAAKNTLNAPLEEAIIYVPELWCITGGDLHRLMNYRSKCAKMACKVVRNSQIHQDYGPGCLASHLRHHTPHGVSSRESSGAHEANDIEEKLKACPRATTYTNIFAQLNDVFDEKHGLECWPVASAVGFVRCCKVVADAIEEEVDKVAILQHKHGHIEEPWG